MSKRKKNGTLLLPNLFREGAHKGKKRREIKRQLKKSFKIIMELVYPTHMFPYCD